MELNTMIGGKGINGRAGRDPPVRNPLDAIDWLE